MNHFVWELLAMGVSLMGLLTSLRLCTSRQSLYGVAFAGIGLAGLGALFVELGKGVTPNGVTAGLLGCMLVGGLQLRILFRCVETWYKANRYSESELD